MAITTVKQFNSKIGSIKKSASTLRDNVQQCFDFGLLQYGEHSNSTFLSQLLSTVAGSKAMAYRQLQSYIQAHANITLTDAKDKKGNVKKDADGKALKVFKKREGEDAKIELPTCNWYEFEKEQHTKEVDPADVIKSAAKRIANAIEKGNLKGTKVNARDYLKVLEQFDDLLEQAREDRSKKAKSWAEEAHKQVKEAA